MDYIRKFDIELEKEHYYAGETLNGQIVVENIENIRVRGIKVFLRGKAHVEWKIMRSGERRTVKEDQYFIEDKQSVWGKEHNDHDDKSNPILHRGDHKFPFSFTLPESALPCSFESKIGTIRYYLRVTIDIPYYSPPQGLKYFTIIGPHIDCMDERYLTALTAEDKLTTCCFCCNKGPVVLKATLDRSGYCCGENIKLKAEVQNGSGNKVWLMVRLIQYVEYFINKGVLGLSKEIHHRVWEYKSDLVPAHHTTKFDDINTKLQVPVMPPTLIDVCKVIQIYYILRVSLGRDKAGEDLEIDFPMTIATVPFRIPNAPMPELKYEHGVDTAEGGMYISPEFQLGQVYDGTESGDETVLYRPVYACVPHEKITVTNVPNCHEVCQHRDREQSEESESNGDAIKMSEIPKNSKIGTACHKTDPCSSTAKV
ncbi:arrestin domain-containing protein 3 [Lingula anatina]|uniref:Arrestin domain-containing protein 3 n=1 Tax=Lingula anatina TaxID=7574 RepID=A0A1S3JUT6_LINAN|nr:arrestin domain-containing protein 3 [Lingula anatina]|eukprot:XP_013414135.1 arrestin domain-containing protein 3 [Lingula anatina]